MGDSFSGKVFFSPHNLPSLQPLQLPSFLPTLFFLFLSLRNAGEAQGVLWISEDQHLSIFSLPTPLTHAHLLLAVSKSWASTKQGWACSPAGTRHAGSTGKHLLWTTKTTHTVGAAPTTVTALPRGDEWMTGTVRHIRTAREMLHLSDAEFCSLY